MPGRGDTITRMKIGLMLPVAESEIAGWPALRDLAVTAEEAGLDSVYAADHLIFRGDGETEGIHECWTLLSAIAAVTSRVEIGPLVLALPFRNPALTAKMAAELDEVSGGRLTLGVGCGWHEPEFDAFGYPFDHRVSRFAEALEILLPLLRGESVTFEGRYHRAVDAELRPRPIRPAGPPVMIAGKQPRMLDLVARHAAQWNAAWYGLPAQADELRTRLANLDRALATAERDPATLTRTAGLHVAFDGADDPPERAIRGSLDEIADALAGYRELGIEHLIAHVFPRTPDAVRKFGEAAELARERLAEPAAVARGGGS
jgi:probable F420-dependent oxidoreductase